MPSFPSDNIYEMASMSLYNTLKGDANGAVRSMLAPDTLSPSQHRRLVDDWAGQSSGPIRAVLSTITNPLVLVGAALAFRWPVTDPAKMLNVGEQLAKYGRYIPGALRGLLGMNEIFEGTPIQKINASIAAESNNFLHRHFSQIGEAIGDWRKVAGRTETAADQVRWGLLSEPWHETDEGLKVFNGLIKDRNKELTAAGRASEKLNLLRPGQIRVATQLGDDIILNAHARMTEGVKTELSENPDLLKRMTAFMNKQHGLDAPPGPESADDIVSWISGKYFPRVPVRDSGSIKKLQEGFVDDLLNNPRFRDMSPQEAANILIQKTAESVTSKRLAERTGILPPDPRDLKLLGDAIDPEALRSIEGLVDARSARGEVPAFSLKYSQAVHHYGHSLARSYAWNADIPEAAYESLGIASMIEKGERPYYGGMFLREADRVSLAERLSHEGKLTKAGGIAGPNTPRSQLVTGGGRAKTELIKSYYLPVTLGQPTFAQTMKAMEWTAIRQFGWKMVDSDILKRSGVPSDVVKGLQNYMASTSDWTAKSAGAKIAGYFNLTALGLNPGSAAQNLMQNVVTTGGVLGAVPTMRGFASVIAKIPKYASLRASGMVEQEVLQKLWPEFASRALDIAPVTSEILDESNAIAAGGLTHLAGVKTGWDKFKGSLMGLFRGTEMINRLTAFEAGRMAGVDAGLSTDLASDFGQTVTNIAQSWTGPGSTPVFLHNIPAPFKQFVGYPLKLAGFAGGSAYNLGGPFNPGTLGRSMMYSAAAYEALREGAGADISRSLLFGGIPTPEESGPFAPWPLVPPILGITGAVAMDIAQGAGPQETKKILPLLVPGGIQAARVAQVLSPEISEALGKTHADYAQRTSDGRVPVRSVSGNLIGYKTDFQLLMSTMGMPGKVMGPDGEVNEAAVYKYLLGQQDKLRSMRHEYIESLLDNDIQTQDDIRQEYMDAYGTVPTVRDSDFNAARMRRFLPRIDQALMGLPKDVRPLFQRTVGAAMSGAGEGFIGTDPALLGVGTTKQRFARNYGANAPAQPVLSP